jgi:hypothetical protein
MRRVLPIASITNVLCLLGVALAAPVSAATQSVYLAGAMTGGGGGDGYSYEPIFREIAKDAKQVSTASICGGGAGSE